MDNLILVDNSGKLDYSKSNEDEIKKALMIEPARSTHLNLTMQKYYHNLIDMGYNVIAVFLYGSQNYELDTVDSDIDAKAIVLPTLNDMIMQAHPVNVIINMENGMCDVKDIRLVMKALQNQSLNDTEILFTKYCYIDEDYRTVLEPLFAHKEDIARCNRRAAVNQIHDRAEKYYRKLHKPGAKNKELLYRHGYNPKCVAHILRLHDMLYRYCKGDSYEEILIPLSDLRDVKTGSLSHEEAVEAVKTAMLQMFGLKSKWLEDNQFAVMTRRIDTVYKNSGGGMIRTVEELLAAVTINAIRYDIAVKTAANIVNVTNENEKDYIGLLYEKLA